MQAVLNLAWEKLLPAMQARPLHGDAAAHEKLKKRLAALRVRPMPGQSTSPVAAAVSGKRHIFPENPRGIESVAVEFGGDAAALVVRTPRGESRIACGAGDWRKGRSNFVNGLEGRLLPPGEHAIAASGAWTADNAYSVKLCLTETPFCSRLVFQFNGEELLFDSEYNVAFGPTTMPRLVGRRQ